MAGVIGPCSQEMAKPIADLQAAHRRLGLAEQRDSDAHAVKALESIRRQALAMAAWAQARIERIGGAA